MGAKGHWESVYRAKRVDEVSWFQREPAVSFGLIRKVAPETNARIIDVGGGASSLVGSLAGAGYSAVTVLDISGAALGHAQGRLGAAASRVTWLESDVLVGSLPAGAFDVWHDRAVFHFLTEQSERAAYVAQIRQSLRPNGFVVMASHFDWSKAPANNTSRRLVRRSRSSTACSSSHRTSDAKTCSIRQLEPHEPHEPTNRRTQRTDEPF